MSHSLKCKKEKGTLVWTMNLDIFQHQQILVHYSNIVYKDFLRKLPLPLVYESNVSISTLTSYSPLIETTPQRKFHFEMKRSNLEATFLSSQIFPLNFLLVTEASAVARDDAHRGVSRNNIFFKFSRIFMKTFKTILNWFSIQKVANQIHKLKWHFYFLLTLCIWNCFVQKIGSTNCRRAFHKNIQSFSIKFQMNF